MWPAQTVSEQVDTVKSPPAEKPRAKDPPGKGTGLHTLKGSPQPTSEYDQFEKGKSGKGMRKGRRQWVYDAPQVAKGTRVGTYWSDFTEDQRECMV